MDRLAKVFLVAVSVLNGLAGIACGILFLASPDGSLMQAGELLPVVQGLPLADVFFQDFTWIGIAMLLVLAVPNTVAAVLLFRRHPRRYTVTLAAACLLLAWTGFELIFMINPLAVGYFVVGVLSVLASMRLIRSAGATVA